MKTWLFALAACSACYPLATLAAKPALDLRDVSKAGMPGKAFATTTSMPASVATVCAAIQDFAGYPQFMPNVDKVKVTSAGGGA